MRQWGFDLEEDPGWTTTGEWAFGQPSGQGGQNGNPDPDAGATGVNVYGVNLDGDYSLAPGGPYHLTAGPFDCSELTEVELRFQRWLNSDFPPYVFATVEASEDGIHWLPVWQNEETVVIDDEDWVEQVFDLSTVADYTPSFYLRWGYQVENDAFPYSGWNLDDLEIWGVYTPLSEN
jgi:hypothetical protein